MIYDNIRTICEKKNISIKQVERELGFSNSSICKWNECEPSVWKVQKVLRKWTGIMHRTYHALGGNGMVTKMKQEIEELHIKRKGE